MGNAFGGGVPAPHSPSPLLRLRKGKRNSSCPCFLSEHAPTWDLLTIDPKFRLYVLRHLLDEGLICSVLEHGEREHALAACEGVLYFKYMEESRRGILREKLEAWQRAAGAGVTSCDGLSSESAFGELQLARPLRAYGFLPTLQRRLAVLRELGAAVAEEHRSRCRPFHMRLRSPPPTGGGQEQGDVRLALMMNAVALQSLSTLASLAAALQDLPPGRTNADLIRAPFAMLANMLEEFPAQSLFKYWSPLPSEPEKRVSVDPETATASCFASLARLAVTGGLHVGWKSKTNGTSLVTWQVALSKPATELTSVKVQWGAGDPATGVDQNGIPIALIIEASMDGGNEWHRITGGDEAVDVALARKTSPGSSQHRYPVSLLALQRQRESQQKSQEGHAEDTVPAVTHIRLKMKVAPASRSGGGALMIYDVAINARDPSTSPSDVMTVLRQVQTFLLAQHSQNQIDLREDILRALIGVCQASCALEFELDLVRVYMDMERFSSAIVRVKGAPRAVAGTDRIGIVSPKDAPERLDGGYSAQQHLGQEKGLQALVSTLLSAACRAKRQACRQDRERVIRDAGFDQIMSSKWVVVSEGGQLVSSADSGHSHSLLHQCLRRGIWTWELALERESSGDETTCVGVAVNPVTNSCYEDSHQMWMVRCYSGETYSNGGRRNLMTCKIHPLDSVHLTLNCEAGTLSLDVNGVDQGIVFSNVPPDVHPAVCFYGITKSVRLVELKRMYGESDSDTSDSEDESDVEDTPGSADEVETPVSPSQRLAQQTAASNPASNAEGQEPTPDDSCVDFARGAVERDRTRTSGGKLRKESEGKASRRKAAQLEEQAIASNIRASTVESPSTGLLASLANFAQWYVPHGEHCPEGVPQHGVAEQRAEAQELEEKRMTRTMDAPESLVHTVSSLFPAIPADDGWGIAGSGGTLDMEARRYFSLDNVDVNDPWRRVDRGGGQSNRLGRTVGRPSAARRMSSSSPWTGIPQSRYSGEEPRRTPSRVSPTAEAVCGSAAPATSTRGRKGKPLPLEEPYIIQPTHEVFQKLYDLLVRSLACLRGGEETGIASTTSTVLSLLQIMRANFCRLVDAHIDPAEVGLSLDYGPQQHALEEATATCGRNAGERLLPNILRCLQDIMLQQQGGDAVLLRATVDTFSSGLPLLMPRVEDRLHLLLGLVRHLQCHRVAPCDPTQRPDAAKGPCSSAPAGHDVASCGLAQIPRERVTLLRDLLKHFARTESVLQLLALFEEDEGERNAISDLLELMLTSIADKACPRMSNASQSGKASNSFWRVGKGTVWNECLVPEEPTQDSTTARQEELVPGEERTGSLSDLTVDGSRTAALQEPSAHCSYWEQLVASGAGGTRLNFTLLETCQQHLLCMVLKGDRAEVNPHELLLCQYGQCLLQVCCRVLSTHTPSSDDADEEEGSPWWQLVGVLLPPFLHGLCMCADRPRVAEGMLPPMVYLSEVLSRRITRSPTEAAVTSMAEEIMRQTQLANPEEGLALAPSGWHPVRASFEVDKDSMTSFSISEDGQLYSALTSSNTCALVDVGVSQGKAAWEFLLEEDSPSDECSVFGIATKPPYSRCYNSSQSLWMRRAYNGVLYNRGRQLPVAQSMSKIHPGDVVRCEVDMDEGTVRFSINGEKQDGGFDGVEGEVFPCAGSYRSGVTIRLLKMEVMGGIALRRAGDDGGVAAAGWDPTEISWVPAPCSKVTRAGLVSIDKKAIEMKRMNTLYILHQAWAAHKSARVHPTGKGDVAPTDVSVEARNAGARRDVDVATTVLPGDAPRTRAISRGGESEKAPPARGTDVEECTGVLDIADAEAWDWVSVRATHGFAAMQAKHAVEMEVTPVGSGRRRTGGTSGSEDRNSLRRYPMAFGVTTAKMPSHDCPIGLPSGSWAWWTDGSLRAHGEVLLPAVPCGEISDESVTEELYGAEFLPLKPCDVVTMVADTNRGTLRYLVNGVDGGIAFGPSGSGAVCVLPDDKAPFIWDGGAVLFPSCSLTNDKQVVQLRPGGTLGTQLWPLSVDLHKTVASLAGRLCATMVAGTPQDEAEVALEPWLRSPLLSGGIQASEDVMGEAAWHSLGRRSWAQAWNAEQEGRPVRTRSFMAWGSAESSRTSGGEYRAAVAEAESGLSSRDGLRLTVRVVYARKVPQGLVLWPDDPCVRLTTTVDGRIAGCAEEVLIVAESDPASRSPIESSDDIDVSFAGSTRCWRGAMVKRYGEVRVGQREHVFEVWTDAAAVGGMKDPVVSIRVDVLVGGVVAATGQTRVDDMFEACLLDPSSEHVSIGLSGGGEISLAIKLGQLESPAMGALEDAPQGSSRSHTSPDASVVHGGLPLHGQPLDPSIGPKGTQLKCFLDTIASWGLGEHSTTGSNGDTQKRFSSAVEESPGCVNSGNGSWRGSDGERQAWSGRQGGDSVFPDLVKWLSLSHPDPPFLKMALEKTGNYDFPPVEAPFVAALLKHSGLAGEAVQATEMMSRRDHEGDQESSLSAPTKDMAKLWGRVRQLRAYLRTQRQQYKVMAADGLHGEAHSTRGVPHAGDSPVPEDRKGDNGDVERDEKDDNAESEMEEKDNSSAKVSHPTDHGDREVYPATFPELCVQIAGRACFLLELSPSTIQSPTAAAEGTSVLMHHLAEELSDLPTPPPARLQSRLLRWRSEDHGKERWKGVVDVLRVQSQLRRGTSMIHRPRANSLGNRPTGSTAETVFAHTSTSERNVFNPFIRKGRVRTGDDLSEGEDAAPTKKGSLCHFDEDSGCASGDESDDSGKGALLDDETAASAALQACTIYVITGAAVAPPRALKSTLRNRTARAAMRTFGMEALAALLRTLAPEGRAHLWTGAPSAVQEALVFLRPAFQGVRIKGGKDGKEAEITSDERDPRHHYLKGLEGCSAALLAGVQSAFEDLYGLLRTLLDYSLQTVQPGLAHVLMTSWALDFESRDYRFLANKSGILPTLQATVTLTNTASMASSTLARMSGSSGGPADEATVKEASPTVHQRWTPWSLENIREGFIQGTLMTRDLARHISGVPPSALPMGFLEKAGLHGSAVDILGRHTMASLMRRYSALLRVHLKHTEANLEKVKQAAAMERTRLEKIACERVAQMVSRGVPVLDEGESRKAPEVHLTALCSWATVPMVESVACTFARGATYACIPAGETSSVVPTSANSGNYFEVTIMNPGEKTTIGVGLADPDVFPATKQMPGWVDHSYGYHGDDGRKFGRGKTDSIWPTWMDGDVVGCGFDPGRGAIWYTRNGKLLGDGFMLGYESNLVPVVGFHSNGESVRVNFGVAPFTYEGPEVIVAPAVLAERELLQREARDQELLVERLSGNGEEEADEEKTEGDVSESKERDGGSPVAGVVGRLAQPYEMGLPQSRPEAVYEQVSTEMLIPSMKLLQRGASSLLHFLVSVSMRQASLTTVSGSEEPRLQGSPNETTSRAEDARLVAGGVQELLSPKGAERAGGNDTTPASTPLSMPPTRERSMYGTPLKQMQTHADSLHQDLFDLILRELRLGALSIEHILGVSPDRTTSDAPRKHCKRGIDADLGPIPVGKTNPTERTVKAEMQRSYSHGHCRPVDGGWHAKVAWQGLDSNGDGGSESDESTAASLGLLDVEIGEVEPHVFRQLALLCSVRHYSVAKAQLVHPSALRSIFSLLKVGSPRIQRCVLLVLETVLPGMEPSAVDSCLPEDWVRQGREHTGAPNVSAKTGSRKDQENGASGRSAHSFDGLVGVLFSMIRQAYSPPVTLPGSLPSENDESSDRKSVKGQGRSRGQGLLAPGCDEGFGGGMLDLCLAEQCSSLLRVLYKEPAWKELIARKLLLAIRIAASAIREISAGTVTNGSPTGSPMLAAMGGELHDISSDAVAALAIIAGSSGVLYPGAVVESKSGALGTVVMFSPDSAEAGVVFDGENVEACETVLVRDLQAAGVGFQTDPDTAAQPVVGQLLSLLGALLESEEVTHALAMAGAGGLASGDRAMIWSRLLSQTLVAVLHLSNHCSDAVVAACQEGNVVGRVLPTLLEVAVRPVQLPSLITAQEFGVRWRAAQARMLSALRLGNAGLRTLQPMCRYLLPPPEPPSAKKGSGEAPTAAKPRYAQSPSGSRDALSAEESREECLMRPQWHAEYGDPSFLEMARSARTGGRGRLMTLGDAHRSWGRGWGSAMHGRRAVGARGTLDWVGRTMREDDDSRREGGRRRLLRSDLSHRMSARGRRAASAESRLDPRRSAARVFHEHDRLGGFVEARDEETGALLVEFNDGTDEAATDAHGMEGGSAGSADSGDTSQDGDEEDVNTSTAGIHDGARDMEQASATDRGSRPTSPEVSYYTSGEGSIAPSLSGGGGEARGAESETAPPVPGFPISHVLDFETEARGNREAAAARLSSELGIPLATALGALAAFGEDEVRVRQWVHRSPQRHTNQASIDAPETDSTPPSVGGGARIRDLNAADETSGVATDNAVVGSLIGAGDAEAAGASGEAASVPSAEEGFNLWEGEREGGEVIAQRDTASMQSAGLLCEHDLVPVLGFPRPAVGTGGPAGSVTTSFLVREVDILVPGSLVMVTAGEGYAPDETGPCATVASELSGSVVALGTGDDRIIAGVSNAGQAQARRVHEGCVEERDVPSALRAKGVRRDWRSQGTGPPRVVDGEEVLVEMMDSETGLCLGKRVPIAELRHSTTFFGRELDREGYTVKQVLHDTDTALAVLRARSLLVRLIHSLPTPAIAAAGGPRGLLNITRLLAAQDLAKGTTPALMESTPHSDGHNAGQSAPGSMTRDRQGDPPSLPEGDRKVIDPTQPGHEPLLKVLWRKVMDSPEQWVSNREQGAESAALGEMLAQEVLHSFSTLTTTPQIRLSGDSGARTKTCDASTLPRRLGTAMDVTAPVDTGVAVPQEVAKTLAGESISHESLHPLCTPLSYGGHIKVDPSCHGMVIKLDSRSRTSSELLRLQFFSSKEDMLNDRHPLRVMHGHVAERAARAQAKGMEFFKIEEADSTSYDTPSSSSAKETLTLSALDRLALPPALVRQSSTSTTASLGSPTPLAPGGSSRRPVLTSRAMTRAMYEVHSQMVARRKARPKDAPVPTNQGDPFRSFALPGVVELWFRFDAPPGAEKPPVQITCLAGSLAPGPGGTVQASASPSTGPGTRARSDHEEDLSQEELGLQALFASFGEDQADDASLPTETCAKSVKSVDSDERSRSSEAREQDNDELPGCLAAAEDVLLTSGKWFYEATVESLMDPVAEGEQVDDCLVRIGWAQVELVTSVQLGSIWKWDDGGLAWDSSRIGAEQPAEACAGVEGSARGVRKFERSVEDSDASTGAGKRLEPWRRTVSWYTDSLDASKTPPMQEGKPRSVDSSSEHGAVPLSESGGIAKISTPTDTNGLFKAETAARSVAFPVLGSDAYKFGFGLGQDGLIWIGRRPRIAATNRLAASDVVGCAFDVDSGAAWFSVNGRWVGGGTDAEESASMMKTFGWAQDIIVGAARGVRPCVSVRGRSSVSLNFGATPFKHRPPGQDFMPVVLRDVPAAKEDRPALGAQMGDSRVAFAPEVTGHSSRSSPKSNPRGNVPDNWGFRFVVDPLHGVHYRVVRELELVCRFGGGAGGGSGSATTASSCGKQVLSIWRPKAPSGWFSIGDVTSRGLLPPAGAVVVRADTTGCLVSKPAKFRVVHQDKTTGYVVWRPVARKGQVSLGDFACAKKASKGVMAGAVRCVAAWAVEASPVVQCLWREEKQSGTQAIWAVQNGLGTFFGSQTGGRLGKKEVTQGPHSRAERQKRKKKKKKKKKGSVGGDSSEDDEGERVKLQLGVGEGWALKGVSGSCITNEWCQESDVVDGPIAPTTPSKPPAPTLPRLEAKAEGHELQAQSPQRSPSGEDEAGDAEMVRKPRPSVSWASWLLSFLLNHPPLRRLAMRGSLFRTLVAYLRSPGAPHRLRMVPLLTLLVRSHAEFEEGPPPLEELSGLLAAVLRECDRATCGRGPGSAAWRPGDCPGGLQLETRWANAGLLFLTDLAMATRRAQDSLRQRPFVGLAGSGAAVDGVVGTVRGDMSEGLGSSGSSGINEGMGVRVSGEKSADGADVAVKVTLPPFGTRLDESPVEEGGEEEAEEAERGLVDLILVGRRSLSSEDRALLEVDLRNSVLPDVGDFSVRGEAVPKDGDLQDAEAAPESPSRCLHHLLEIMDTLQALRDGWPSPSVATASQCAAASAACDAAPRPMIHDGLLHLDSLLCEAWMDAVGPAAVIESEHPFRKGTYAEKLHFPGADDLAVFLDPRSSMQLGTACLVLEGKDKMISLTGRQETSWGDVISFRGDSISYRFVADTDGDDGAGKSLVDEAGLDDWGFRFTVVAKGPVWECTTIEGELCNDAGSDAAGHDSRVPGALSLLVELDQTHALPRGCGIEVLGFDSEDKPVQAGLLSESTAQTSVYVRGDRVRVVPSWTRSVQADSTANSKEELEPGGGGVESFYSEKCQQPQSQGKLCPPARETRAPSEPDAMPDADAKLERLPSNAPVLRPSGEAAGVEQRWQSAGEACDADDMEFAGASYVSNAATVVVGDSDAESKDGSFNSPASSAGAEGATTWSRYSTVNDIIATAVPLLSALSSDISETPTRGTGGTVRGLAGVGTTSGGDNTNKGDSEANGHGAGGSGSRNAAAGASAGSDEQDESSGEAIGDDIRNERVETGSSRPRACAGAKDVADEVVNGKEGHRVPLAAWKWAVQVRAAAIPRKACLQLYLERRLSLGSPGPTLEDAREWMTAWTPEMDDSLLELLANAGTKSKEESTSGRVIDTLNPWCCRLTRAEAKFQQQRLAAVPTASLHIRAALLLRLNDRIERVLPVIDLASKQEDSLGWQLREMNHLVLPRVKNAVLEAALAATQGPGDGVAVTLDNIKAMMSRDRGERDLASSQCVFAQAYRQLTDTEPKVLRTVWDGERVFQINFVGEDGVDAGGVFREGMSRMVEDLFSPDFDLLIQCPNGRQAIGQNNEKFVPNPQHSSPLALSMLRFVGRLMGLSLRTRLCLPFEMPGMIWKRMLGLQVGFADLRLVDTIICQFITAIETCEEDGLTSDKEFRDKYGERLFFTCTGSDGMERELMPGGMARRVTFDNRKTFCRLVEQARTHEFDAQAEAMAEGLSDIVPMKVLRLFTASQLEIAVAGEPEFDIDFWKKHTEYKGYRPEDATVEFFWQVIESMSREDQSGFVRFAWGRSRLPPKAFWRVNMKLLRRNTSEDSLPVSHTCFFSVELPPYTTEERTRKGILTAIHFGMGGILNA